MKIGVIGSGAMGAGIAQVAVMAGEEVRLFDNNSLAQTLAFKKIEESINKFVSKDVLSAQEGVSAMGRIYLCNDRNSMHDCDIIIEAVVEDIAVKMELFSSLEKIVGEHCVFATNTSSLSITAIASALKNPGRCIGVHFFNPPVLMKLVEIIPALQTEEYIISKVRNMIEFWGKTVVIAKDTPGFIVNKIARPYYSEAIRIFEEGIADMEDIDFAMTSHNFKMGPFALMDFIGHDVNYRVTESVWKSFFYDSRYRPSFTQLRLLEAGYLGKKTGKGFYDYSRSMPTATINEALSKSIFMRILSMLVNEAADTIWKKMCSQEDAEIAVKFGLNYPMGLMEWGNQIGFKLIVDHLDDLFARYKEERYRVCLYLRNLD